MKNGNGYGLPILYAQPAVFEQMQVKVIRLAVILSEVFVLLFRTMAEPS